MKTPRKVTDMNTPTPALVLVSTVAAEVGVDTDTLAARLAADVITDEIGVRWLPTDLAQRLIAGPPCCRAGSA